MHHLSQQRPEGLLLRHLNSVYKVLRQTVPDPVKPESVIEMEVYLRDMLRQVDSSLLEEWEKMQDPDYRPLGAGAELRPPRPEEPPDVTRDTKAFTASIRTRICSGRGDCRTLPRGWIGSRPAVWRRSPAGSRW